MHYTWKDELFGLVTFGTIALFAISFVGGAISIFVWLIRALLDMQAHTFFVQ